MLVNCKNYFNDESFDEICKLLEAGEEVEVYIDCIGHTRNNYEQNNYRVALVQKYGRRIDVILNESGHSVSYKYKMKDEK